MYIVILGGDNDISNNLSNSTLMRLKKFDEIYNNYKNNDPKIIISGGFRFSQMSHCSLIKKNLQNKYPNIEINKEFEANNNTVDEAINIGKYLVDNNSNNVIIITSNWHMNRAKYLFEKVFELIDNVKIEYIETDENEIELEQEEELKLFNLKHKPYGKWKEYILNTYSDKLINKEFIKTFGKQDSYKNYISNLTKQFCLKLFLRNDGLYEKIEGFEKLWLINKYKYQQFISQTIGKIMNLHDFDNEYSKLITNTMYHFDTTISDKELKEKGIFIPDFKIDNKICYNIISNLEDKYFNPFDSNNRILGKKFLGKNVRYNNSSTFWIENQNDIASIKEVQDIAMDPFLLKIVQNYLGCKPILCQTNLWYSCVNKSPERTQQFHQDYDDINFLKIFIYLTKVGHNNGPHCYIQKSLNNMIVPPGYSPSTRLTDKFAIDNYKDNIKILTGDIGTIIIENTNGFHRGMPVLDGTRLILQLQYASTTLPFQQGCKKLNLDIR